MKTKLLIICILFYALKLNAQTGTTTMPRLTRQGNVAQLLVDNKPYLILGGELGNSSASSMAYMEPNWIKLNKMHLNTVIVPVYWELMEPTEAKFNFALVDKLIESGRYHHLKLVLLWFGAWKNSMSCYAPLWVKTNTTRFPRAEDASNIKQEIMTPFSQNNLQADKKAFVALMSHLKAVDQNQHTVIMVQVENEIGMLPSARDHSSEANSAFHAAVPVGLINYLEKNKDALLPETKSKWEANGFKTKGSWEEVFGKNLATDEIFMAWYFARYVNEITVAGKLAYNLPMYVNAALNRPNKNPGEYPSAGPLPHLMDVWKAGAPAIDIFSPDIYFPELKHWADLYVRSSNPLFIPEADLKLAADAKAFYVMGHYNAIGFSPFSIESVRKPDDEPIGKAYNILSQLSPLITKYQGKGLIDGVLLEEGADSVQVKLGGYILTAKHDYTFGRVARPKDAIWPATGAIIIAVGPGEFFVGGTGTIITFKPDAANLSAGIAYADEGQFIGGKWVAGRRMNGDQDHQGRHIRIPVNEFGIQHIKVYKY
jgi:beta-galactosidase GanA